MKKIITIIMLIFIMLAFASCTVTINVPTGKTKPPMKTTGQVLPTEAQVPTETPPEVTSVDIPAYTGPSIVSSYGEVLGGYADGQWLSHSEAAQLCSGPLKFYMYNLAGLVGTADTTGITSNDDDMGYFFSRTGDMAEEEYDEGVMFSLLPEHIFTSGDYNEDPLSTIYYYTTPPENMPEISVITDTSALLPLIQQVVDENLGAGAAQAQIRVAVSADIDNDGKEETIINADNCDNIYDGSANNVYTIACIIESDGSVIMLNSYFVKENEPESSLSQLSFVQNIIDLDGDGMYELVVDNSAYESWWAQVFKYDGATPAEVLLYGSGV